MIEQEFYKKLNIGWDDILIDSNATMQACKQLDGPHNRWEVPFEHVRQDFQNWLKELEVELYKVHMFYTHFFNNRHVIHIDDTEPGESAKLNWVYGNNDADMIWYCLKPDCSYTIMNDKNNNLHYTATDSDVYEIARTKIDKNPTIVRTGILHTAINHSGKDRFVCQTWLKKDGVTCTFNELVKIFTNIQTV